MEACQEFCNESGGDNRLNNWEKWLYIHKKQSKNLITKINRNSNALLMNRFINEQRYIKQEKKFIDKAEKYIKSDYYRGHPAFWKFPTSLKCPKNTSLPPCYIIGEEYDRTKPDPAPPFPEYVCTADKILFEQGIVKTGSIGITKWINSSLINNKLEQIKRNIQMKIHRPDFEKLIVSGEQLQNNINKNSSSVGSSFDSKESISFDQIGETETGETGSDLTETFNETDDSENNCIYVKLILLKQPIEVRSVEHVIREEVESHSSELNKQIQKSREKEDANDKKINFENSETNEQINQSFSTKDSASIMKDVEIQVNFSNFSSPIKQLSNTFGSTDEKVANGTDLCEGNKTLSSDKSQTNKEGMPTDKRLLSSDTLAVTKTLPNSKVTRKSSSSTENFSSINVSPETKTKLVQVNMSDELTNHCEISINFKHSKSGFNETVTSLQDLIMNFRNESTQVNTTESGMLISDKDNQSQLKLLNDEKTQHRPTLSQTKSPYDDCKSDQLFGTVISDKIVKPNNTFESSIKVNEISNERNSGKIEEILQHFEKTLFYGNCETNRRYERILEFVNENPVSVRYEWLRQPKIKYKIINSKYETKFFFNKNSGAIGPGGSVQIRINFKSKYPGVFRETWVFQTIPPTNEKPSLINFEAIVFDKSDDSKRKYIERYLGYRMMNAYARNKVNEMINRIDEQSPTEMAYCQKLTEEDIFHHNNPDLFYESNSVHILKDINYKITSDDWDYSVQNLRQKILKTECSDLKAQYLEMFSKHVYNLMKPAQKSILNKKYITVNEILCSFFDQMEHESINLKKSLGITRMPKASCDSLYELKYTELVDKNKKNKLKRNSSKSLKKSAMVVPSLELITYENEYNSDLKKDEYVQCLYIKTYEHLSTTIEEIAATLESISVLEKRSIFSSLGK